MLLFWDREESFIRTWQCALSFPPIQYTCDVKLDAKIFYCISMVLTGNLFENLHVFRSFKVRRVLTFTIIKEENDPSLQEYGITTWKDNFLVIFKISSIIAGYPS